MRLICFFVLIGVSIFIFGLLTRKRKIILIGVPAVLLFVIWFFLASTRPNPQKEFDRLFGASNRSVVAAIQTIKPTFMDGHFISFQIHSIDFNNLIRPQCSEFEFKSPSDFLFGQSLPLGWPSSIETTTKSLYREVEHNDVYLLYFPSSETTYVSVRYEQE